MAKIEYDKQRRKVQPPVAPLSALRAALGITQTEVCNGVEAITNKTFTKGALSAIENGHRGASAETLAALETVMRLPTGSLVVTYAPSHDRRKVEEPAA